jgi:phosphate-selective porin OprO/OprP
MESILQNGEAAREELPTSLPLFNPPFPQHSSERPNATALELGQSDDASNASDSTSPSIIERLDSLEAELKRVAAAQSKAAAPADDALPTSRFTMQLQADAYTFGQDAVNLATVGNIPEGTAFRRARVGWTGNWQLTEYRIEFDFALAGRPSFLDVWAGWKDVPLFNVVHVGHFFEPFSLERMTPNRFMTFMERNLGDAMFAPARNLGIAAYNHTSDERFTWAAGVFAANSDNFGDSAGFERGEAVTGRITWLPVWDELSGGRHYVHLGAAGSFRNPDADQVRFATQPEARLGAASPNVPNFIDTGTLAADREFRGGLEAAWIFGSFSLVSEYMCSSVDRIGATDVYFDSWYVECGFFLTGEHRPYKRTMPGGVFDRVIPNQDFCLASRSGPRGCGWGAWQIASRLSHADANDENVFGRELTDVTIGLNWFMTPYMRFTTNYIHAFLDDPVLGDSDADILGFRLNYDF